MSRTRERLKISSYTKRELVERDQEEFGRTRDLRENNMSKRQNVRSRLMQRSRRETEGWREAPALSHLSYILNSMSLCPFVRQYSRFHRPRGRWHGAICRFLNSPYCVTKWLKRHNTYYVCGWDHCIICAISGGL